MSLSPHQILSRLADQERMKAQEELATLGKERQRLEALRQEAEASKGRLRQERERVLEQKTEASVLWMIEEAMQEQQDMVHLVDVNLQKIHEEESQLLKDWIAANRKHDTHDKIQKAAEKKQIRLNEQRIQRQLDDLFASFTVHEA